MYEIGEEIIDGKVIYKKSMNVLTVKATKDKLLEKITKGKIYKIKGVFWENNSFAEKSDGSRYNYRNDNGGVVMSTKYLILEDEFEIISEINIPCNDLIMYDRNL